MGKFGQGVLGIVLISKRRAAGRRIAAGVALTLTLLLAGCGSQAASEEPGETAPVAVETALVERGALSAAAELVGTALPSADISVLPKMNGQIISLEASEGDVVEKGATLARLDSESLAIQLELEELGLAQAQLQYKNAVTAGAPKSQLDQLNHTVRQSELRVRLARLNLDGAVVTAPRSGLVTGVTAQEGGFAAAGQPLLRIVALDPIQIQAKIDARMAVELQKRATLPVEFPDVGVAAEAEVTSVAAVADASGFYTLKAELPNPGDRVKPGMLASIRIDRELAPSSLLVPTSAIIERSGVSVVYVVRDGRATIVEVTMIEAQSARAAVAGALKEGDAVVVKGQYMLSEGASVTVVDASEGAAL